MRLIKVVLTAVFIVGGLGLFALPQSKSVLTVCPSGCDFDRIQSAVYAAAPGSMILIKAPGLYYENLIIRKSLTIKADSQALPVLILPAPDEESRSNTTILIESTSPIRVFLEDLIIWGSRHPITQPPVIYIRGQAQLIGNRIYITYSNRGGLEVYDRARVTLEDSKIFNSGWGASVQDSAQLTLINSAVFSNDVDGLWASEQGQLRLISSAVYGNLAGLAALEMSKVVIENSLIHNNRSVGILASGSSVLEVYRSTTIANNQVDGIFLINSVNFVLKESFVYGNGGWGVSAWLIKCGQQEDRYIGTPYVDETNVIVKNGRGDVCLP